MMERADSDQKKLRSRNRALMLVLAGMALLFYLLAFVQVGASQ